MLDFSMSKRTAIIAAMAMLSFPACAPAEETPQPSVTQAETPPPIPEGQETVAFERETSPEIEKTEEQATTEETAIPAPPASPYWGIEPGEPLPIMWDDLMPEGSEEEMLRQQDEFYRMLEQRYMANSSRLADAAPLDGIEEAPSSTSCRNLERLTQSRSSMTN